METFVKKFVERFGYKPDNIKTTEFTTHIGLHDVSYSAETKDKSVYSWSASYGWDDED